MNIKQFLDEIDKNANEFDNLELVNSHQNNNIVSVSCINNEKLYTIVGIELDRFTCGCESGITILIREEA